MTVTVVLGSQTTDKSGYCIEAITEQLQKSPHGKPIIFITPEQMTFQQESRLLKEGASGSIRAQVLSFSRLALRVMEETGGAKKALITSTGIQMMLRKIIEQKKTDWRIFQKSVTKRGFIEQLEVMITEFKRYQVTPEMLKAQIELEHANKQSGLTDKLEDLHYIYQQLTSSLANNYIDSEDRLRLLEEKIEQSAYIKDSTIYMDGFHRFTPQEQAVVAKLMKQATNLTITLTLPNEKAKAIEPFDIFTQTKDTYDDILALAKQEQQKIEVKPLVENKKIEPFLRHLDRYFDQRPLHSFKADTPITLAYGVHPRAEVEGVAQEILTLVRDHHYRYRDIALLVRDGDVYHDLIRTIFEDYHIPIFIDEKEPMLNHPLIELIRSLFEVIQTNWRYDAVFRLLKTGFIPQGKAPHLLNADAIDTLENYVLEYGIRGKSRWVNDKPWLFQRFKGFDAAAQTDHEQIMQTAINAYRSHIVDYLAPIEEALQSEATVKEKLTALFQWLERLGIDEQLEQWQVALEDQGLVQVARNQEQVWQKLVNLFDETVEIIGEEMMPKEVLFQTLEAGLDTLTYQHVPPTLDHVIVASIDRSRLPDVAVSMLLGVNEGQWPKKPNQDTVLTEEERHQLEIAGIQLADSETEQLIDDWFYIYLAVTSAKERLWISYHLSDSEGKAKAPANLIKRMQAIFPNITDPMILQDPEEMLESSRFITTQEKTRSALTAQLAKYRRHYPIDSIWWSVLNWYLTEDDQAKTLPVLASLFYQNKPAPLKQTTVDQLYHHQIKASVSRMEMYHRCSYQHFSQYSLNLEDRPTYKLDAPDIGQLFHEALKQITEWVQQDNQSFKDIQETDANRYAKQAIDHLAPVLQHQILHSSNRYQYMKRKLETVIARATFILSEQARRSAFTPVGLEIGFGLEHSPLAPVRMNLANGYELVLRGRIDRVDHATLNDQLFLRIIDYKSSRKDLNLIDVYYGLALQMLAYLDVLLKNSEAWLGLKASPAGVLYFHVHDAILSKNERPNDAQIETELFKDYKMRGLLLDQKEVISLMDEDLEVGFSPIIPAALKKDGEIRSGSKIAAGEDFTTLQNYVHQLIEQAGLNISSGEVSLNPYQDDQQTACTYCPFKSVCQFDPSLDENNFRQIKKLDDRTIIEQMKQREES